MTDKEQAIEKLFDEGLSCTDGCTHFLDESQKRYLISQILKQAGYTLSSKPILQPFRIQSLPSTANRKAVREATIEFLHRTGITDKDFPAVLFADQICSLISPPMEVLEWLDKCFELAPEDDSYFRILVKDVTEYIRTGKDRKQRADEAFDQAQLDRLKEGK